MSFVPTLGNVCIGCQPVAMNPMEEGMPNHLFIECFAAYEQTNRLEKIEDIFSLLNIATSLSSVLLLLVVS
jgi:hypothetical protein